MRIAILINCNGYLTMKTNENIRSYKCSGWKVILNIHTTENNLVLNSEHIKNIAYNWLVKNYNI